MHHLDDSAIRCELYWVARSGKALPLADITRAPFPSLSEKAQWNSKYVSIRQRATMSLSTTDVLMDQIITNASDTASGSSEPLLEL